MHKHRLLPLRQDEKVYNGFWTVDRPALEAGTFVSALTAQPSEPEDYHGQAGAAIDGTFSPRHTLKNKVYPCPTGATASQVIGVTLLSVAEADANGQIYRYDPQLKRGDGVVVSGEAVPIAYRGTFALVSGAYEGVPEPGRIGIVHETVPGKIMVVDDAAAYAHRKVGRFLTYQASGARYLDGQTGWAMFELQL